MNTNEKFDLAVEAVTVAKGYDRLGGRSPKQFIDKVLPSNKEEDHPVAHISQLNNAAGLVGISIAGLGAREKYYENAADILNKGDHKWFFHGSDPFDVNIELKSRKYTGSDFRPKQIDVNNCLKRNIPYLLIQNAETSSAAIILLRTEDLLHIKSSYESITHEIKYGKPWSPYEENVPVGQWKLYYKCNVFDNMDRFQNRKISYEDLKRNGSYDEWLKVVAYFRHVSGNQS